MLEHKNYLFKLKNNFIDRNGKSYKDLSKTADICISAKQRKEHYQFLTRELKIDEEKLSKFIEKKINKKKGHKPF